MKKPTILVIGSSNTDMVIQSPRLPAPGETILGGDFFMNAGGKGANQAVACARLGGKVVFVAKLGKDIFGDQTLEGLKKERINVSSVFRDKLKPSGIALINVDAKGENCITVASGANSALSVADLKKIKTKIASASILLMQLETPLDTIQYAASLAFSKKRLVILNPAPACLLPDTLFKHISIITPNEKEASMLTGIEVRDLGSAKQAAMALKQKGTPTIIITMGSKGALLFHENKFTLIASPKVKALDSTAAGDVFNGALAVGLAEQQPMKEAVRFACRAAAISVTRLGAQASAPYRKEIK